MSTADEMRLRENIGELTTTSPLSSHDYSPLEIGQARPQQISPQTEPETKSPVPGGAVRRRTSGRERQSDILESETLSPPEQPSDPSGMSTATANRGTREAPRSVDPDDGDDEDAGAPATFTSRRPADLTFDRDLVASTTPRWLVELYTISYLIFFSFLGTLARLGLQWLTFYPGTPILTPVIWANFAGSLCMGYLAEDEGLFREKNVDRSSTHESEKVEKDGPELGKAEQMKRKKAVPLYIGLATGFCGSLTSFSSFARDAFLALSNSLPSPLDHPADYSASTLSTSTTVSRNGGYSFEAWAAVVISTLALSLGGLLIGAHLASFLESVTPRIHTSVTWKVINPIIVFLAWGCWLGAVFLAIWPVRETWRGEAVFALVFAPLGCLLRFYASAKLNGLVPAFPLGTFTVNMLGTAIEGMCYDIQHVRVGVMGMVGGGRVGCQVLQGVQDGFCGCLTTISTWVAEINSLRRKHGYGYAFASVLGSLCLMVVIMGSVRWTVGYSATVCDTGYPNKIYG
ncbi:hypothetical protein LTR62_000204 [Meristemomyces frigidus]|uniref:Chromosome condensation protein n=1 Tax=Meristemomyces frigidus TaxID=1508187 RepID=A0AAN7YSY6_9PEZI|nr:hypothetical protein LTR62_000204 [Meristemomyces frigidus]